MLSSIACLNLLARHHGISFNPERAVHETSLGEAEPSATQLASIARRYGFKARHTTLSWKGICESRKVFPLLLKKKAGGYVLLTDLMDDGKVAIIDPTVIKDKASLHTYLAQDAFEEAFTHEVLFLKRRVSVFDENPPFGFVWFLKEFLKSKEIFAKIAFSVLAITLLSLGMPLFFQIVIDKVLPNSTFSTLNVLGIGVVLAICFNAVFEFVRSYLLLFVTRKVDLATGIKTFGHLMHLPLQFFEAVPSGLLIKHMQQAERIRGFLSGNLFFTALEICTLVVFIPFLMLYSVSLTGIVLLFTVLMALVVALLIKPYQQRLETLYKAEGMRQSHLVESLHGIETVKTLALEPEKERKWNDSVAFSVQAHFNVGKISITANTLSHALELLMGVAIIWAGAHLVFNHVISIGALIAFQMLSSRVSAPLVRAVGLVHEYQQVLLSVKMLGAVMNTPTEPAGGDYRNPLQGEIEFSHVNFTYNPALPDVLHDFNLNIRAGEVFGIVGRSGSGKSTLLKLIEAIYSAQAGQVKIDGMDIREIEKTHLRRSIGVVLQESYFFSGSIRENLLAAQKNASSEAMYRCAKVAGAHEFITALPKGYDTVLEENAMNLSGGQKQRLALARALLRNPSILILDEATSALDPESESIIRSNMKMIASGRTVIVVAHRLSMVRDANQILVLNRGRIEAQGTHDELLKKPGLYHDFWFQQMGEGK